MSTTPELARHMADAIREIIEPIPGRDEATAAIYEGLLSFAVQLDLQRPAEREYSEVDLDMHTEALRIDLRTTRERLATAEALLKACFVVMVVHGNSRTSEEVYAFLNAPATTTATNKGK